jgi:hypothetical protein
MQYTLSNFPETLESRSPWLLGCCSHQLRKSCAGVNMVYSRAEHVFILEHFFTSKSFSVVHEAFSNVYLDKEVLNKTTIHWLVTKFWDTGSVWVSLRRWWTAVVKLFCKFFLTILIIIKTHLSCYIDVTKAYKFCCSQGCILNGKFCILTFIAFIDFTKVFHGVHQNILSNIMEEKHFPKHLMNTVESLYVHTTIQIECAGISTAPNHG